MMIDPGMPTQYLAMAEKVLTDWDDLAIRMGDTGPLDRLRETDDTAAEHEREKALKSHEYGLKTQLEQTKRAHGGTDSLSGAAEEAQWLVDHGVAKDHQSAYALAKTAKTDHTKAILDAAQGLYENHQLFRGKDDPARSFESFVDETRRVVQQLTASDQPASSRGLPSGGAAVSPNAPTAINPRTGERLILQDGQWVPMR